MKSVFQRPLLFLPLFFLVLQPLAAQTAGEASAVRSLLWEIKGKGLTKPSYLYGTIHLIGKSDFFLTEATEKAFGEAQRVAFEIDLEEMGDFSTLMPLLMQSFMKKDTTLSDLLLPEEYRAVKAHFEQLGLPMFFLDRIKPMFLTALDPQAMARTGEAEETVSYEIEFLRMAQEADKPIDGLETAAFQMSMFDSIPYRVQAKMLVDMVKGSPEGNSGLRKSAAGQPQPKVDSHNGKNDGGKTHLFCCWRRPSRRAPGSGSVAPGFRIFDYCT